MSYLLHWRFICILFISVSCMHPSLAGAREKLRVVAWDGYADPEVVAAFEKRYQVDVDVIQVSSDDDLWEKINKNNAADYDVFAVNTAELQRYANYGSQQLKALRDAGADVGYAIPQEGALAWLDCWAVTRGTRNRKLAEAWVDYTLEKSVSERLPRLHGLANTITRFPDHAPDKIVWLEPVEDSSKRQQLWDRILSGDSFLE